MINKPSYFINYLTRLHNNHKHGFDVIMNEYGEILYYTYRLSSMDGRGLPTSVKERVSFLLKWADKVDQKWVMIL